MRVIAGIHRSRPLVAPRGIATRPTSDRLRETLFNVIGSRIESARFADLFAGSGAVGIEALSRGASDVWFADNRPTAIAAIEQNLRSLGIASGFTIETRPLPAALRIRERCRAGPSSKDDRSGNADTSSRQPGSGLWDIVFLDPPYHAGAAYQETLHALGRPGLLVEGGLVIAEHERQRAARAQERGPGKGPPILEEQYGDLRRFRILEQGDSCLSFYRRTGLS